MTTVCNSTPIISLSSVGQFGILQQLFGEIVIAEAVYQELKAKQSYGYHEIDAPFVRVMPVQGQAYCDLLLKELDKGEAETIILAKELNASRVLIDENLGYRIARNAGLNVVRTLSILLKAKEAGIIPALKNLSLMTW